MSNPRNKTARQIFDWLSKEHSIKQDSEKYDGLIRYMNEIKRSELIHNSNNINILVVGGGDCKLECKLISGLGLEKVNLWVIDIVDHDLTCDDGILNEVHWISEEISWHALLSIEAKIDLLFCLSTSRYFDDTIKAYTQISKILSRNAVLIIDFYELPIIRQVTTKVMRQWLLEEWSRDPNKVINMLEDLAIASQSIARELHDKSVLFKYGIKELGIDAGTTSLQKIIYESFFPFWYRSGASVREIVVQLIWLILCQSNNNSIDKITQYANDNRITVKKILQISKDTRVLIGSSTIWRL